jgi:ribosomal protein S18 acetylase RimI-like enzyme
VPFTIRPAAVADADAIGAVHVRAWHAAYRGVMPDEYLDGLRAQDRADGWRRHLTALRPDQKVLVVVDRDGVVGFAFFGCARGSDTSQDVGELYAINLDPEVWDRGIGRALLRRATDELAAAGYAEAVLWVVPQNQRARHLYESEGWIDNNVKRDDEIFGVAVPEMLYRRLFGEPPLSPPPVSE